MSIPRTAAEAAIRWADIYISYANEARSCQGVTAVPAGIEAARTKLVGDFTIAFAGMNPLSTAILMSQALTDFWILPPQTFIGVTPGVVTAVLGTEVLQAGLLALWAADTIGHVSADFASSRTSDLFKAFTMTVVVTHSPPSVCASPLVI